MTVFYKERLLTFADDDFCQKWIIYTTVRDYKKARFFIYYNVGRTNRLFSINELPGGLKIHM